MITLAKPKKHISDLWSSPVIRNKESYRVMRYVLVVEEDNNVLLHNVVTGHLILLDQEEQSLFFQLPCKYQPSMQQLIEDHFLVSDNSDEFSQIMAMRKILRKLSLLRQNSAVTTYTILPTTACNARCYYCFEKGSKISTMTKEIADGVVRYIINHCKEKKVFLSWFGGEPTVASDKIDHICEGLLANGINYSSSITTNGYLFDDEMIHKAKVLWNLSRAQITIDGIEETYNKVKAYVNVKDNPYQRVMRNINRLLVKGVRVNLRMNFDVGNYHEFFEIVKDVSNRYKDSNLLQLSVHPVIGEYPDDEKKLMHGDAAWFEEKILELNSISRKAGFLSTNNELPYLQFRGCQATNDSAVTITPEGYLVRCPEQYGSEQVVGNIWTDITDKEIVESWKQFGTYEKCKSCVLLPYCVRTLHCSAGDRCNFLSEVVERFRISMRQVLYKRPIVNKKGGMQYANGETEGGVC